MTNRYPNAPGHKVDGASELAAHQISEKAGTVRDRMLRAFENAPGGMTPDTACDLLGVSVLTGRPRVTELHKSGQLIKTNAMQQSRTTGMSQHIYLHRRFTRKG